MKAIKEVAMTTALLLSLTAFTACGTGKNTSDPVNGSAANTADTAVLGGDGIIEGSFGTVEGQSLPEAKIPDKPENITSITDEEEQMEKAHKVFEANTKASIFSNHTSMTLALDDKFTHPNDAGDYFYMTPDSSYMHSSYYEQYSKDREVLQWCGTDTKYPFPVYLAELSENYDGQMYWYVPSEENDFFDTEHEHYTDMFVKDGRLWEYSRMDETGSKKYLDMMMGGSYEGEIVNCVSLSDAETYELIEVRYYVEKDGKSYLMSIHKMEYDQPESEAVGALLSHFEIGDAKTATVTYTANPGKDNEISKSLTVPQFSTTSFFSLDIPDPDVFLDPECTKSSNGVWDGTSDKEYYIIPKKN